MFNLPSIQTILNSSSRGLLTPADFLLCYWSTHRQNNVPTLAFSSQNVTIVLILLVLSRHSKSTLDKTKDLTKVPTSFKTSTIIVLVLSRVRRLQSTSKALEVINKEDLVILVTNQEDSRS
jgi:hypothetical protein